MSIVLFLSGDAILFLLALVGAGTARRPAGAAIVYGGALAASLALMLGALARLIGHAEAASVVLPIGLPWIGAHFRIDALSAFFIAVVNLAGAAASLYAFDYGRHEREPWTVLPFYPAFLAAMNLVLVADDAFTFLTSWEFMSLASWPLVMAHHRELENARAGYVYIVMASFGAMALLLAFALLAGPAGGYTFAAIRLKETAPGLAGLVLGLTLLGAGSKAGLAPLHVWLPLAHPAAPSHVSALMSGVMTKVAVYGFVRIVFDLLGPAAWWWGAPVMALGAASAVLGVLHAVMETDLKRILAYSTVENIGLVFAGLGLALAFKANGLEAVAALAATAALFHVLNHAIFKSLLFFGAGAVLISTGERGLGRLGGLINRMPATGLFVLVGCGAICALPPLNGFASEWLLLQAVLLSPQLPQWALKLLAPAVGAMLALAAALAAACFARAFGVGFLGRPRSPAAERAREAGSASLAAMGLLAGLCLLAGIAPGFVIDALAPVARAMTDAQMPAQAALRWLSIAPIAESRSSYNGLLVFLFIVASASLAAVVIHRLASNAIRKAPTWDCGFPDASPATQYTAESFSEPIRRVFGGFAFKVQAKVDTPAPGEVRPAHMRVEMRDLVWEFLYEPVLGAVQSLATRLNVLQFLTIRQYLSVVFGALVSLLMVLAAWP